tara:strand:+ start:4252 stop:5082 length:831 start_codon:yes stop_codon:yes gene_type:complete
MKGFVHNADQAVYINGLQMSGISSMDATYTIPAEENNFLGYVGPADLIQNAPGVGNFSFQRVMMSSDEPITELLLMDDGFDGGIEFNSQEINFQSGYINSYECSFAVDSLPQSTVSISAYGEVGPSVVKQKSTTNQKELFTPTSSGISIDFDGRQTNRVTSFSFSMNLDHKPVYKIGSIFPCEVVLGTPIRQSFSIEIDVDDYQTRPVYDYMRTGIHFEDIKVILKDQCDQSRQIEYNFNDAHLLSEQFSTDADNNTTVKLNYATVSRYKPSIIYR